MAQKLASNGTFVVENPKCTQIMLIFGRHFVTLFWATHSKAKNNHKNEV